MVTTDPELLAAEWDILNSQAEIITNLLRATRVNPWLSVYAYIFGKFDLSAIPMAPPGTKVLAHLKPGERPT